VHRIALGSGAGNLPISKPDYTVPQDFGLFSLANQTEGPSESVEVRTVDSFQLSRLDFIKIDVEGMEGRVPGSGVGAVDKWPAGATVQSQAQAGHLSTAAIIADLR